MATMTQEKAKTEPQLAPGEQPPRLWVAPLLGALPALSVPLLAKIGLIAADRALDAFVLAAPLPLVALLFGPLVHVGPVRRALWVALAGGSIAIAGLLYDPLPAVWLALLHTALAAGIALAAYRDPVWQMRLCLRSLRDGRLPVAHRAYGRFLMLTASHALQPATWRELRAGEIPESTVAEIRARFSGMVNACRYGDIHGLGDVAYGALFPEVGEARASAEEG